MIEVALLRKSDDIVIDQKIGDEALLLYEFQFLFYPLTDLWSEFRVASDSAFESFLSQKIKVFLVRA